MAKRRVSAAALWRVAGADLALQVVSAQRTQSAPTRSRDDGDAALEV